MFDFEAKKQIAALHSAASSFRISEESKAAKDYQTV